MKRIIRAILALVTILIIVVAAWNIVNIMEKIKETVNRPPISLISSPSNESIFFTIDSIYFDGANSSDPDNDTLTFYWFSNINGCIGLTPQFTRTLSAGAHLITMYVNDGSYNISTTINIVVLGVVTPIISTPKAGADFLTMDYIYFDGINTTNPCNFSLTWYWWSNITGYLGNKSQFYTMLPVGNHLITLYVNDNHGHNVSTSISVSVDEPSEVIWDKDIVLSEDYTIEIGETLVIKPGVTVYLDAGVSINVHGTLTAEGTKDNMITFTHNNSNEYWDAIKLQGSYNCTIKYCKIEYGGNNDYYYYGAVYCCSPVTVAHCIISNTTDIAITCWSCGSPNISNNTITNNMAGIFCLQSSPEIFHNNISDNTQYGIMIREYSSPNISYNNISYNGQVGIMCIASSAKIFHNAIFNHQIGITCTDYHDITPNPIIHQNDIYNNREYGVRNYNTSVIINATYNFWGSTNGPSGEGHGDGDKVSENIEYEPWLNRPVITTKPIVKFVFSPLHPDMNETIHFNDTSIDDGLIVSWFWEFGDGNTSSEQNVTYQYSISGTYNITLTVEDNDGETATHTETITVGTSICLLCGEFKYQLEALADIDSFNFTCAVPCKYEDQVPIFFEICNDTTANITKYEMFSQEDPNNVVNFTIGSMRKDEKVLIHLKYWLLVKNKYYDDLPNYVEIPGMEELPNYTKTWLTSTAAIQANNSEIIEKAELLRNNNSNLVEVAQNISEFLSNVPYTSGIPQDALSTLYYGGVCTGHANLGTALFRANGVPAKNLIVIPTGGIWLQWHFISEYYCPNYGWVWVETSLGQTPFEPKNNIVIRVNYPEDENEAGINYGGVEQIYWVPTDNVSVSYGNPSEDSYTKALIETEIFTSSENANNSFLIALEVYSFYMKYIGKELSSEGMQHFENALNAQRNALERLRECDINGYTEYMNIAYAEYNLI